MKRNLITVALVVVFVLAFSATAFAQGGSQGVMDRGTQASPSWGEMPGVASFEGHITHSADYKWDGTVDMKKQSGHLCNTGASHKQTITGDGEMDKVMSVRMVPGKLTVADHNDFVSAPDAVNNLTVTSVIELCAPPKQDFGTTRHVYYSQDRGWQSRTHNIPGTGDPGMRELPASWYYEGWGDARGGRGGFPGGGSRDLRSQLLNLSVTNPDWEAYILSRTHSELREIATDDQLAGWTPNTYHTTAVRDKTRQIWAVSVEADPGFSGNLHQDFEAAYGFYENDWRIRGTGPDPAFGEPMGVAVDRRAFGWREDPNGYLVPVYGDDYVGNYFNIEQWARTSQGTVKRFIDVSSPFSLGYLMEDFEVVGQSEIQESFTLMNLRAGDDVTPQWWELF